MERRICSLFLSGMLMSTGPALAAQPDPIIDPDLERRDIRIADIEADDFEFTVFGGIMNVEDFGTNPVYGARAAYHVTEDIFVEAGFGTTTTTRTSFERLSGAVNLLQGADRDFTYYNVSAGLNIMPGETFLGDSWAFRSSFYVVGGIGSSTFADEDHFTWHIGAGYRVLLNDWFALHIDARDHVYESDLLGDSKTSHNLELTGGLSIFF